MKRPGRPPVDDENTPARVHVTLPSKDFDRADLIAKREGVSVPELLRRGLTRVLDDRRSE
jgi:hypothetical protein